MEHLGKGRKGRGAKVGAYKGRGAGFQPAVHMVCMILIARNACFPARGSHTQHG